MSSKLLSRLENSPTVMTWSSFLTKGLMSTILIPFILVSFSPSEVTLWFIFQTIIGLQLLADLGFNNSFARSISYAFSGAKDLSLSSSSNEKPNWELLVRVLSTSNWVYKRLGLFSFIVLATGGTAFLIKPIELAGNGVQLWASWLIIMITAPIYLYGNFLVSYLNGINRIELYKKWETIMNIGWIISTIIIIYVKISILTLVLNNQFWLLLSIVRNYYLARNLSPFKLTFFLSKKYDEVLIFVKKPAIKSAFGILFTFGLTQFLALFYAQVSSSASAASYLLALRLIMIISQLSQAPFYSKIPVMNMLNAKKDFAGIKSVASRGMRFSYWICVSLFLIILISAVPILDFIESKTIFVEQELWLLLCLSLLIERFGSMHIQVYSVTNHIIWHYVNGIQALLVCLIVYFLFEKMDVYVFPLSSIISLLLFSAWYPAIRSYRLMRTTFIQFEKEVLIPPTLFFFLCTLLYYLLVL